MLTDEPNSSSSLVFISWAPFCSRSDSIAERLGGRSYMVYSPSWGSSSATIIFKYLSQSLKTLRILIRERPDVVVVMTPPVIACVPVWLYCIMARARFAIDAHSGALMDPRWEPILFLHRWFSRCAVTTVVTSEYLQGMVLAWGASSTIVADVPVIFAQPEPVTLKGRHNMTFVSTFTKDEPLAEFFDAARMVPEVEFYVTGGYQKADPNLLHAKPGNVELTGFLPDSRYVGLVSASDAILSLTTFDHTMQRGAYEAVYLRKPVITSNFDILKKAFPVGAVYVDSTAQDIARGIRQMKDNLDRYRDEVRQLRAHKLEKWEKKKTELAHLLFNPKTSPRFEVDVTSRKRDPSR